MYFEYDKYQGTSSNNGSQDTPESQTNSNAAAQQAGYANTQTNPNAGTAAQGQGAPASQQAASYYRQPTFGQQADASNPSQAAAQGEQGAASQGGQSGRTGSPWTQAPGYSQSAYGYANQHSYAGGSYTPPTSKEDKPKKHKGGFAVRAVAMCLVCALIGGAAGFGASELWGSSESGGNTVVLGSSGSNLSNTNDDATDATPGEPLTASQVYEQGAPSVVSINTTVNTSYWGQQATSTVAGTGFIISSSGYIVTNYHVVEAAVENGYTPKVSLYSGETYDAQIVGYEAANDIAVLKIEADDDLPAVVLGDSGNLTVGDNVYAIGNALGTFNYTLTGGYLSAMNRSITFEDGTTLNMLQFDAAINSGNSGGPLFNDRGEVVGIVTAKSSASSAEGLGFAIPISDVIDIISDLIEMGYVTDRPYMGIVVSPVLDMAIEYYDMVPGAYVTSVESGSCAETAGLQPGDIITAMGDTEITSTTDLTNAKNTYRAGDTTTLTVYRNGEYLNLTITFDEEVPTTQDT